MTITGKDVLDAAKTYLAHDKRTYVLRDENEFIQGSIDIDITDRSKELLCRDAYERLERSEQYTAEALRKFEDLLQKYVAGQVARVLSMGPGDL